MLEDEFVSIKVLGDDLVDATILSAYKDAVLRVFQRCPDGIAGDALLTIRLSSVLAENDISQILGSDVGDV